MNKQHLNSKNHLLFISIFCTLFFSSIAQNNKPAVESFENSSVLEKYKASPKSTLEITNKRYKYGKQSLKWSWNNTNQESSFSTSHLRILSFEECPLGYSKHFIADPIIVLSFYNEEPQDEKIKISFLKDEKEKYWFEVPINFSGWRSIWVPFHQMQGSPIAKNTREQQVNADYTNFKVSTTAQKGSLYFDDIVFSQFQDSRHPYPDFIVPFVESPESHWKPLISNINNIDNLKDKPISESVIKDLNLLKKELDAETKRPSKRKVYLNKIIASFNKLGIEEKDGIITGPPLAHMDRQVYFDEKQQGNRIHNKLTPFGEVTKQIASAYGNGTPEENKKLKELFVLAMKYFLDQGWQKGASGGTRHHVGYPLRNIVQSCFVMREELKEAGILDEIGSSLEWLNNLGVVLGNPNEFHVNIDYLNTQAFYHLMILFLSEDYSKQAQLLEAYSKYMSIILAQQNKIFGFKIDGTSWHHAGHYPAYGAGALKNVPRVIKALSATQFRIDNAGHENFKKALLTARNYSNTFDYGFGNAGRHPFAANNINGLQSAFLQLAESGTPDGKSAIDKEVAAAYLRLWGKKDVKKTKEYKELYGIQPEVLSGYKIIPYGATAIHRNNDWAAIIKGYSKYVWASEIYVTDNRYGRYPANGTIQLLNKGGKATSGYGLGQKGWDWNRYPGGTIIHLPFDKLEPDSPLIMFRSNETFAGAVEQNGNGVFSMILNESKGSNADGPDVPLGYLGKLSAKKSVFSFGEKLICVGTDISSIDTNHNVETVLFQAGLNNKEQAIITSKEEIKTFPVPTKTYIAKKKKWLIDPYNNGYYILSDNEIKLKKNTQQSYHNKYSINAKKKNGKVKDNEIESKGDYAVAWINHGKAPNKGNYQYVIYPFLSNEKVKQFGAIVKKDANNYKILRADSFAHIVKDKASKTTAYAIFKSEQDIDNEFISTVSQPAIVMLNEITKNTIQLNALNPDLNIHEDKENYIFDSRPSQLSITLHGDWMSTTQGVSIQKLANNNTQINFSCKDGFAKQIILNKQ